VFGRSKPEHECIFFKGELDNKTDFSQTLEGIDVVIHCAARAHVMNDTETELYEQINTLATLSLAKQAAALGAKRFIFISTIKVNGESTLEGGPFRFSDKQNPSDPYGISKANAEIGLQEIAAKTGMAVVIIRPPLVYGPGVKANFAAMLKLAKKNLPLPLGAIHNKRSLVAVENLVDLVLTCIDHPAAANQTFLVSDDCDVSTTELLRLMTLAAGKKPILLPIPVSWLKAVASLAGKQSVIDRLCGNLQVDISHTKQTLGWKPPITLEEGITQCVADKAVN
jgi:nucleoside-diphosphate-sugar epimerase